MSRSSLNATSSEPTKSSLPSSLSLPQLSLKPSKASSTRASIGIGSPSSNTMSSPTMHPDPTIAARSSLRSFRNRFSFSSRFASGMKPPKDVHSSRIPSKSVDLYAFAQGDDDSIPVIAIEQSFPETISTAPLSALLTAEGSPLASTPPIASSLLLRCPSPSLSIDISALANPNATICLDTSKLSEMELEAATSTSDQTPQTDLDWIIADRNIGSTKGANDERPVEIHLSPGLVSISQHSSRTTLGEFQSSRNSALRTLNGDHVAPVKKWSLHDMKQTLDRARSLIGQKDAETPLRTDDVPTIRPNSASFRASRNADANAIDNVLEQEFGQDWRKTVSGDRDISTVTPRRKDNTTDTEKRSLNLEDLDSDLQLLLRSSTPPPQIVEILIPDMEEAEAYQPLASSTPAKRHPRTRKVPAITPNRPTIVLDTSGIVEPPSPAESSRSSNATTSRRPSLLRTDSAGAPTTPTPPLSSSRVDIAGWRAATSTATTQSQSSLKPRLAEEPNPSPYDGRLRASYRTSRPTTPQSPVDPPPFATSSRLLTRETDAEARPYTSLSNRRSQPRPGITDLFHEPRSATSLDIGRGSPLRSGPSPSLTNRPNHNHVATDWSGMRNARMYGAGGPLDVDAGRLAAWRTLGDRDSQSVTSARTHSRRESDTLVGSPRGPFSRALSSDVASRAGTDILGHPPSPVSSSSRTMFSASSSTTQSYQFALQAMKDRHEVETDALISALAEAKRVNRELTAEGDEYAQQAHDLLGLVSRLERRLAVAENVHRVPTYSQGVADGSPRQYRLSLDLNTRPRAQMLEPSPLSRTSSTVQKRTPRGHQRDHSASSSLFPALETSMSMLLQESGPIPTTRSDSESEHSMSTPPSPTAVLPHSVSISSIVAGPTDPEPSPTDTTFAFTSVTGSPGSLNLRQEDELHLDDLVSFHLDDLVSFHLDDQS